MGKSASDKSLQFETYITRRKLNPTKEDEKTNEKKKKKDSIRKVSLILQKCETSRTPEEQRLLESHPELARVVFKRQARAQLYKERIIEKEDPIEVIERKSQLLAQIISRAKHLVCYTGAGISTSARIPDYRGSQGIWTLLQQGKEIGQHDLSLADPTYTHMALYELHRRKMLRFVVSQNCDGLHLRAGLPKQSLSEVHGNMYVEVCKNCKPNVEYWRLFDTTELTARFYHKTNRRCRMCNKPLNDTIVHFGERGNLKWPLNWAGACVHSEKADVILCLGSSLKVLKKYSWLWQMDKPLKKRAKICIVNLQWTPKDKLSTIKIDGKCDEVMQLVMKYLNINVPEYDRSHDPIFSHASLLCTEELHTVSQPMLKIKKEAAEPSDENETAFTSSDNDSRILDAENSRNENSISDVKVISPVRKKKPLVASPAKTIPYVKTSLNSKHLILAEESSSSNAEDSENENGPAKIESDEKNSQCISIKQEREFIESSDDTTSKLDLKLETAESNPFHLDKLSCSIKSEKIDSKESKQADSIVNEVLEMKNIFSAIEADKENKVQLLSQGANVHKMPNGAIENNKTLKEICSTNVVENPKEQNENGCDDELPIKLENHHTTTTDKTNTHAMDINEMKLNITNPPVLDDSVESNRKDKLALLLNTKLSVSEIDVNSISCKEMPDKKTTQTICCDNFDRRPSIEGSIEEKSLGKTTIDSNLNSLIGGGDGGAFSISFPKKSNAADSSSSSRLNRNRLYEIGSLELTNFGNVEDYYKDFFEYYRAVEQKLPFWYDVGYAYSGLHSIIQPPPPEIDLWSSKVVPIFKMDRNDAECQFCFDNYAEFKCQFYRKYDTEFSIKKFRNGRLVMCECCDYTDDELNNEDDRADDEEDTDEGMLNVTGKKNEKRAKLDVQVVRDPPHPAKVQAGWYGKGYRKNFRKKKR